MRSIVSMFPVVLVAVAALSVLAYRRRERRQWQNRRISGGRKALVLNLYDRD